MSDIDDMESATNDMVELLIKAAFWIVLVIVTAVGAALQMFIL